MKLIGECELKCGALLRLYKVGTCVSIEVVDNLNFAKASHDDIKSLKEDRWYSPSDLYSDKYNHISIFAEYPQNLYEMLKGATEMLAQIVKKP